MPRLPVVSGRTLLAFMESRGYQVVRRRGSHIRLSLQNDRGRWFETVPDHRTISRGTLGSILRRMNEATGVDVDELICLLGES